MQVGLHAWSLWFPIVGVLAAYGGFLVRRGAAWINRERPREKPIDRFLVAVAVLGFVAGSIVGPTYDASRAELVRLFPSPSAPSR